MNTAKVRRTQTMPKPYIRKPIVNQDEVIIKIHNDYDKEIKELLAQQAKQLEKAEKERKQIDIIFIEHYIGRPLTKEEKQKLMVYI